MIKNKLKYGNKEIPYIENESSSKKLILFLHGLDGSAGFAKPLFRYYGDKIKIVAIEQRGHHNSPIKASRSIKTHLKDINFVIDHFKSLGYEIYLMGESMGGGYAMLIGYQRNDIKMVIAQSLPNTVTNTQDGSGFDQFKIGLMTFITYITNINFRHKQFVNYELMSSNKSLQRIAKLADKEKLTTTKERLATWALMKKVWKLIPSKKQPLVQITYFNPGNDELCNLDKAKKAFIGKTNPELVVVDNAKHILMYEEAYEGVLKRIDELIF